MDINKELEVFNNIKFDPDKHTYKINDEYYISVTTLLGKYKHKWNSEKRIQKEAINLGVSTKIVEDINRIKLKYYGMAGTEFHLFADMFINHKKTYIPQINMSHQTKQFLEFYDVWTKRCNFIKTEFVVGDNDYRIAGTIDCLGEDIKNPGNYYLFDWKTNIEITKENKWNTFMLDPLKHIPSTNFYDYSLQLSLYKHLLEKNTNIKIKKCFLVHFPINNKYNVINTDDMSGEILKLLNN